MEMVVKLIVGQTLRNAEEMVIKVKVREIEGGEQHLEIVSTNGIQDCHVGIVVLGRRARAGIEI